MSCLRRVFPAAIAVVSLVTLSVSGLAQERDRGPGRGPGGGPGGGFLPGMFAAQLLNREDVRKDIELLDDQAEQVEKLVASMGKKVRDMFASLRDLSREERGEKFQGIAEDFDKQLDEILLPHQTKRLSQIRMQLRMRGSGTSTLLSDRLVEELKITESQQDDLRTKAEEVEQKLRKKIAQLRKEAQDDLLGVLSSDQRTRFQEMVGEPFVQSESDNRPGGGFFGRNRGGGEGGDGERRS